MRAPTARIVLDIMEGIQTVTLNLAGRRLRMDTALTDEQRYILELLGLDPALFSDSS